MTGSELADENKMMFVLTELALISMSWGIVAVPKSHILTTVAVAWMMMGVFLLIDWAAGQKG